MGNIQVEAVRADIKDRLDNMVERQQVSTPVRNKLLISKRLGYAIDQAYSSFVVQAQPSLLLQLTETKDATADTSVGIGGDGVVGSLKHYKWPEDAYAARDGGGVMNYIVNEVVFTIQNSLPFLSLRDAASSLYYGEDADLFSVDLGNNRIYAPKGSDLKLRYIKVPQSVVDDNISELKIDRVYQSDITALAIEALMRINLQQQADTDDQQQDQQAQQQ